MGGQCTLVVLGWHQSWRGEARLWMHRWPWRRPSAGEGNLMCQSCRGKARGRIAGKPSPCVCVYPALLDNYELHDN